MKFKINNNNDNLINVEINEVLVKEKLNNNQTIENNSCENGKYLFFTNSIKNLKSDNYFYEGEYLILNSVRFYRIKYINNKFNISDGLNLFKNNKNNNNLKYLYYILKNNKENKKFINGSQIPNLKTSLFMKSKINIHKNIEEQNKIVNFIDNNLESNLNKINNLKEYTKKM